jgi:4-amino-4-deoxy-L-arabinose transferase-like glycosyltransferase
MEPALHRPRTAPRELLLARAAWLAVGGLFFLALAVRLWDVTDNPRGFFTDEASLGVNAHLILTTGRDEHGEFLPVLFRSFDEYKLPFAVYFDLPFVAVFGRTELGVRASVAVLGALTVVSTYLLGRKLFRRELPAVAAAAFLAIMPWHIHYSRTGFGELISFPLILTLALWLFLREMGPRRPHIRPELLHLPRRLGDHAAPPRLSCRPLPS